MGLSFHYSGKIKDKASIPQLIAEVEDVCSILQWDHRVLEDDEINGIVFSPPECEPVFLCFDSSGLLCSPILLQYGLDPATTISVKTQYAGVEVHKAVLKLLKHLSSIYFMAFKLDDEGDYWQTMDEGVLTNKFSQYNLLLEAVSEHLKNFKADDCDTPGSLAEKLEQFLAKRFGGDNSEGR